MQEQNLIKSEISKLSECMGESIITIETYLIAKWLMQQKNRKNAVTRYVC